MGTPPAEVDITEDLIRRLIEAQCPRLGGDIRIVSHGWDNVTARIGEAHAARLPRRRQAVPLIRHEQRWLPGLAARLDIAIPVPLFAGSPGSGYPWPWSIVAWIDGETAEGDPLSRGEAAHFGHFLANLHAPAPPDAPPNPYRGTHLADRDASIRQRINDVIAGDDAALAARDQIEAIWTAGLAARQSPTPVWLHGDLHPRNVITRDGRQTGVIDWGDITGGDAATDLGAIWMQFPPEDHGAVWEAYGTVDGATRRRARAWAVAFSMMLIGTGLSDDPGFLRLGHSILSRALIAD